MNSILYLVRGQPGNTANETVDMVLVSGVFEQTTTVVFLDDGVYQLLGDGSKIQRKDTASKWSALPTYDISRIFVLETSLVSRGIDPQHMPDFVTTASEEEFSDLLRTTDCVVSD